MIGRCLCARVRHCRPVPRASATERSCAPACQTGAPRCFGPTRYWQACRRVMPPPCNLISNLFICLVSLVVTLATGEMTEAAMVGKDGAIGIASALDGRVALSLAVVQLGGDALVCDPAAFRGVALQSENLISKIMRHEQTLFAQAQQSTACMANHEIDARLCRWLLRARFIRQRSPSLHAGVFG